MTRHRLVRRSRGALALAGLAAVALATLMQGAGPAQAAAPVAAGSQAR